MQNDDFHGHEQQPTLERRLSTIMMADVVGYSRMMGENEERTVQILRAHREVFDALLASHRGRIFNTAGDAILAEFPSAVEAVRCATEIQSALRTRNEHLPEEQRMQFRIGINLGDVIVQGTDLLGDGVNVAARIQTIADPGGICISGSVYDQIQNKLSLQFTMLGERNFKNIARPIRTFSISEEDGTAIPISALPVNGSKGFKKKIVIFAWLSALLVAAACGYWLYHEHEARRAEELRQKIEAERQLAEVQRLAAEKQQAIKDALERAEAEKKQLDLELKRAKKEKHVAEPWPQKTVLYSSTGIYSADSYAHAGGTACCNCIIEHEGNLPADFPAGPVNSVTFLLKNSLASTFYRKKTVGPTALVLELGGARAIAWTQQVTQATQLHVNAPWQVTFVFPEQVNVSPGFHWRLIDGDNNWRSGAVLHASDEKGPGLPGKSIQKDCQYLHNRDMWYSVRFRFAESGA
ncbi:adenylate/guanylate cyclase domain-containing protein [Thermodesulfobacteriota bacterium]